VQAGRNPVASPSLQAYEINQNLEEARMGEIRVGIGGWTYEPWRGVFYPDKLSQKKELEFASRA